MLITANCMQLVNAILFITRPLHWLQARQTCVYMLRRKEQDSSTSYFLCQECIMRLLGLVKGLAKINKMHSYHVGFAFLSPKINIWLGKKSLNVVKKHTLNVFHLQRCPFLTSILISNKLRGQVWVLHKFNIFIYFYLR